jgi:hypothetical protein
MCSRTTKVCNGASCPRSAGPADHNSKPPVGHVIRVRACLKARRCDCAPTHTLTHSHSHSTHALPAMGQHHCLRYSKLEALDSTAHRKPIHTTRQLFHQASLLFSATPPSAIIRAIHSQQRSCCWCCMGHKELLDCMLPVKHMPAVGMHTCSQEHAHMTRTVVLWHLPALHSVLLRAAALHSHVAVQHTAAEQTGLGYLPSHVVSQ